MEIEKIVQILIMTHVGFGSIALVSGAISMIEKKGNLLHKKSGKVFYYTLLIAGLIGLPVTIMPDHESPFLFCVSLFSIYFIIGGYRSLEFKKKGVSLQFDKILAGLIILVGSAMILYPILFSGKINIILCNFGVVSILFGIIDFLLFKNRNNTRKNWLNIHLTKMLSAYMAATTAFIVNVHWVPGIWAWFVPTFLGNIYLAYWLIKLNKKKGTVKDQEYLEVE